MQYPHFRGTKGAILSPDRLYRFALWRIWTRALPLLMFIGVNPSTANEMKDDPTIQKCMRFAVLWGYGGLLMGNLAAFRSSNPKEMQWVDPAGPDWELWMIRMRDAAGMHVAAWGNNATLVPDQLKQTLELFPELYHLGRTAEGYPLHPMARGKYFIPLDRQPVLFER